MSKELQQKNKYGDIEEINKEEYIEFQNIEEAEEWGSEKYKIWAEIYKNTFLNLSRFEKNSPIYVEDPAIRYFGEDYKYIHEYIYTQKKINEKVDLWVKALAMAVFSAPSIDAKIVVYKQVPKTMINDIIRANKKGIPYEVKSFFSTSMLKTSCLKNCPEHEYMLKIYVDDTIPIHAIFANVIMVRSEEELLLQPGLYINMVSNHYKDKENGKKMMDVKLYSNLLTLV